ncbi:MAG: hypothetical protein IJ733_20520 [Lachnospiraceae bacterium]|nr:hypothetical protein [Lachnospiraceae bacterium]
MGEFLAQLKEVANNPNIPEGEKLAQIEKIHAKAKLVQKVQNKFVKSSVYAALPTEEEEREKEEWDGNYVKKSDTGQEEDIGQDNPDNTPGEALYQDVVDAAKEYMMNNRPTGAG